MIIGLDAHCVDNMVDVENYENAMKFVEKYNLNLVDDIGL